MLNKVLIKHLDEVDALEADVEADIDKIMKAIDIDECIENPQEALLIITNAIKELVLLKYADRAAKLGLDVVKGIEGSKKIKIQQTDNPKLNKGINDISSKN